MFWEELTGDLFEKAVQQVEGVCLLPLSCIERHAHHLPLGTDMFIGREVCRRAAALQPAIVFPNYIFTQILEAQHCAGTIAIAPGLILPLLENICQEIARNGLKKIVIVNAHGGNDNMMYYFAQTQLASQRDYVVYIASPPLEAEAEQAVQAQWQTSVDGHAGEKETSEILAIRPELVRKEALPDDDEGMPRQRLKALWDMGVYTGIWWYADYPTHYCGDGRPATAEKGSRFLDARAQALAAAIRLIKQDTETQRLQQAFYAASQGH